MNLIGGPKGPGGIWGEDEVGCLTPIFWPTPSSRPTSRCSRPPGPTAGAGGPPAVPGPRAAAGTDAGGAGLEHRAGFRAATAAGPSASFQGDPPKMTPSNFCFIAEALHTRVPRAISLESTGKSCCGRRDTGKEAFGPKSWAFVQSGLGDGAPSPHL